MSHFGLWNVWAYHLKTEVLFWFCHSFILLHCSEMAKAECDPDRCLNIILCVPMNGKLLPVNLLQSAGVKHLFSRWFGLVLYHCNVVLYPRMWSLSTFGWKKPLPPSCLPACFPSFLFVKAWLKSSLHSEVILILKSPNYVLCSEKKLQEDEEVLQR